MNHPRASRVSPVSLSCAPTLHSPFENSVHWRPLPSLMATGILVSHWSSQLGRRLSLLGAPLGTSPDKLGSPVLPTTASQGGGEL